MTFSEYVVLYPDKYWEDLSEVIVEQGLVAATPEDLETELLYKFSVSLDISSEKLTSLLVQLSYAQDDWEDNGECTED